MDENVLISAIKSLQGGSTLSVDESYGSIGFIMGGNACPELIASFLSLLATRVPTGEELYGASMVMRECSKKIIFKNPENILDTCGTGGAPKTFNVSTAASILIASCGVRVAKHGNRSRTGRGSAEVLEKIGVNLDANVDQQKYCLENVGICFCFAPKHHSAVANVAPVRKLLPFPTLFNLLGPLTNPCGAGLQMLGVWDKKYMEPIANALQLSGTNNSAVVHSMDGLDEISISSPTYVLYVNKKSIIEDVIDPKNIGLSYSPIENVRATSLTHAAQIIEDVLINGREGGCRDMVVLTAGVSLFLSGVAQSAREGVEIASKAIDSGKSRDTLHHWVEASNKHIPSTNNN